MNATIYTTEGKENGSIALPEAIFNVPFNKDMVHQVVTSMETDARESIAHTKNRGEVRGGGKKPWKQKGTGRARHGSRRSPLWVGGGVAHGPRNEKNYARKVNKKMKRAAIAAILSKKWKEGEVLFVESFSSNQGKTKLTLEAMKRIAQISSLPQLVTKTKNAAYVSFGSKDAVAERGFRNVRSYTLAETRSLDPVSLLKSKYVIFVEPKKVCEVLTGTLKTGEKKTRTTKNKK